MVLYALSLVLLTRAADAAEVSSPLGEVSLVSSLVRKHHLAIGIESVPVAYDADRKVLPVDAGLPADLLAPRTVALTVETGAAADTARAVAAAVERADGPFRYRVVETAVGPVLVPSQRRDESGEWTTVTTVLDTPVTLPAGEAPVGDLVQTIVDQILASGTMIGVPTGIPHAHETVRGAGRTLPAREALADIYRQTDNDVVWSQRVGFDGVHHLLNFLVTSPPPSPEGLLGDEWQTVDELLEHMKWLSEHETPWSQ